MASITRTRSAISSHPTNSPGLKSSLHRQTDKTSQIFHMQCSRSISKIWPVQSACEIKMGPWRVIMVHQRTARMKTWTCRKESAHTLATPRATRIVEERTSIHATITRMATRRLQRPVVSEMRVSLKMKRQTVAPTGSIRAMENWRRTEMQRWTLTKLVTIRKVPGKRIQQYMSINHRLSSKHLMLSTKMAIMKRQNKCKAIWFKLQDPASSKETLTRASLFLWALADLNRQI